MILDLFIISFTGEFLYLLATLKMMKETQITPFYLLDILISLFFHHIHILMVNIDHAKLLPQAVHTESF